VTGNPDPFDPRRTRRSKSLGSAFRIKAPDVTAPNDSYVESRSVLPPTRQRLNEAWGRYRMGRVDHGPPTILVGWATIHLAPPIIGLLGCMFVNSQENY